MPRVGGPTQGIRMHSKLDESGRLHPLIPKARPDTGRVKIARRDDGVIGGGESRDRAKSFVHITIMHEGCIGVSARARDSADAGF